MPVPEKGLGHRIAARRQRLRDRPLADFAYRVAVGVLGFAVLAVGIAAIPYPGPGWAIVFVGLAILASEFYWAQRTLSFTRHHYNRAMGWLRRQPWWVQAISALLTAAAVLLTLWLFGALALAARWVGLYHPALDSPLG